MNTEEIKQILLDSKNVYIIPSQEPEVEVSALALFYTLKELGKNVNLIVEELPENLKFLSPSLDYISYPKNFVVSIPNRIAGISQIYYEKSDSDLKIHLTLEKGGLKKDDISFYFSEPKPDVIITLGVKDYEEQLKSKLNSFGFLLDSPIINIDSLTLADINGQSNKNFGKINLIESTSLPEIILNLIKDFNDGFIKKEIADCLLSGLIIHTENFKNSKITAEIFEATGSLMKKGASLKEIVNNIYSQLI